MIHRRIKHAATEAVKKTFNFFWYTFLDTYMKRVEKSVMAFLLSLFHFIAKNVSYTFSVAFITSMGGLLIAVYIALFLYSTVHFESNQAAHQFVSVFTIMVFIAYIPGYYLHFGILNRLRVPCFSGSLNFINMHAVNPSEPKFEDPAEGKKLLSALEKLPVENIKAAAIYPVIVMIPTVLQEYIFGRKTNAVILLAGISSAIFIYVFFTYISAELLTGEMRQNIKRQLAREKIDFEENFAFSIRKKFLFITFLVLIAMTELTIMFYSGSQRINTIIPVLFVFFTILTLAILLFFYLISIEQSLLEIEYAAVDLGRGGEGKLYLSGLDRELIKLGKGLISAADEVNEVRQNLERKIEERTAELNLVLRKLKEKDHRIQIELRLAADIQRGILPVMPMSYNYINILSYYAAAHKVSGDFFDALPMDDGGLAVIIGDVSGHGIPAALVNAMIKITFKDAVGRFDSPGDIFRYMNSKLLDTVKTDEYLTAIIMIISPMHDVVFSNASHRKALVMRSSTEEIHELDTDGLPVGAIAEAGDTYEDRITSLEPADRVLMYTDGLVEGRNPDGEQFGESRLHEILKASMKSTALETRDAVVRAYEEFTEGTEASDDVTVLVLEIDPGYNEFIERRGEAIKLFRENRVTEAISVFEELNKINRDDKSILRLLGRAYMKAGNYQACANSLKNYISNIKPEAADYYILAAACYNLKNYNDSLDFSAKACKIKPEYQEALTIRALSLKKLGRKEESLAVWREILSYYPGNETAIKELGNNGE